MEINLFNKIPDSNKNESEWITKWSGNLPNTNFHLWFLSKLEQILRKEGN